MKIIDKKGNVYGTAEGFQIISSTPTVVTNSDGSVSKILISVIASESISKYDVVTTSGEKANSSNDDHRNKILGVATENIPPGQSGTIQTYGDMDNALWSWTSMSTIFLNGTNISSIAPLSGFVVPLGKMRNATRIFIDMQMSIKL